MAYSGIGVNGAENTHQHFIIIYGVFINERNERSYNYIDPGNGGYVGVFTDDNYSQTSNNSNNIGRFFWSHNQNPSYLIYYDPNSQYETQIPRPNQTEPMEMGNCGSIIRQSIIENNLYCIVKKSKRDYLNNNLSCQSASSPYYEYYGNNNEKKWLF